MSSEPGGFALTYGVELLCERPPSIRKPELLRALKRHCPGVAPLDGQEDSDLLAFIHTDHLVPMEDGALPAQTFIAASEEPFEISEALSAALEQSWSPEVKKLVPRCRSSVLVTDLMSSTLEYRKRLALFQNALAAVLEVIPTLAIHWQPTQHVVAAQRFLEAYKQGGMPLFATGSLNVRMFRVGDSGDDMIMDTLGLAALGLPDVQCHFHGLDPAKVASVLGSTAYYQYEEGDVMQDGHTIAGTEPGSGWTCRREDSLLDPARVVMDLNPGPRFAAGSPKKRGNRR